MNVLLLLGSLREGSLTRRALEVAARGVRQSPLETKVVDPGPLRLPLFVEHVTTLSPEVVEFRRSVSGADALIVASPVYHDSYSGVLKNAIDHLYDELAGKVIGLIAVGGGRTGQGQALEHLRSVFRETGSWVLPSQVAVPTASKAFDPAGELSDKELEQRLLRLGMEVALRGRQLRPKRPSSAA